MEKQKLTTQQLATRLGVRSETVRRAFCVDGHYLGLRPVKLPNHRLLWPDITIEDLIAK